MAWCDQKVQQRYQRAAAVGLGAMNPLTQIKNTQKASKFEIAQGFSDKASWHAR